MNGNLTIITIIINLTETHVQDVATSAEPDNAESKEP